MTHKFRLRSATALPLLAGIGVVVGGYATADDPGDVGQGRANPDAVPNIQLAQATPCGVVGEDGIECYVPRLQEAAGGEGSPCGPCKPCNPCAAEADDPCGPCNPCNPCAAEAADPCGPCNPCNPCAAEAADPCGPCNPCNPCAGGAVVELTPEEAVAAYECAIGAMQAAYQVSGDPVADAYTDWDLYNTAPYLSALHGSRYVNNYANDLAGSYADWEDGAPMPVGAILAKDSFVVGGDGAVGLGPLFLMEKMEAGFNPGTDDWKYSMIMPDGTLFGVTSGVNSDAVQFCADCHMGAPVDHMFFLPPDFRVDAN